MQRLVSSLPETEVFGGAFISLITNIKSDEILPYLQKYGIDPAEVRCENWYSLQTLLDIYHDIQDSQFNVTENLVSIGMRIMEQAPFPENMQSLDEALMSLGPTYRLGHRHHTEQGWISERVESRDYIITADNPYPDELCYGLLWGLVRRFAPKGTHFKVQQLVPATPDDPIRFEVTW